MRKRRLCAGALAPDPGSTRVAIAGAGSIGCFVGGVLAAASHRVRFLARPRVTEAVAQHGLRVTGFDGLDLVQNGLHFVPNPSEAFAGADIVLVCVKSKDTAALAKDIRTHAPGALVISLQNGVGNADVLRRALPGQDVRAAMVPFNVVARGPGHYHRGTSGDIVVEAGPMPALSMQHLKWTQSHSIEAVQWGKLVLNLGNAINALSDLPLRTQLQDRAWRRLMADQMSEALTVLSHADIRTAKSTAAPPWLIPHILRLPTPLFQRIAAKMLTIDAEARSSMWEDLTHRRPTEIDALQGVILSLAQKHGLSAPLNTRLHALIKEAETAAVGSPALSASDILSV